VEENDTLRSEIEFLEDKIILLEKKNEELIGTIFKMKHDQLVNTQTISHSIDTPQSRYETYRPIYNFADPVFQVDAQIDYANQLAAQIRSGDALQGVLQNDQVLVTTNQFTGDDQ